MEHDPPNPIVGDALSLKTDDDSRIESNPGSHTHNEKRGSQTHINPGSQRQSWMTSLPECEVEFLGHWLHCVSLSAAEALEYLPIPQREHEIEPLTLLYVPGGQGVHGAPFRPV